MLSLKASRILLKGDNYESCELFEPEGNGSDNTLCDKYLIAAAAIFASGCKRGMC